jgi:hypothetical protein
MIETQKIDIKIQKKQNSKASFKRKQEQQGLKNTKRTHKE